jgi:hypothetical protein
MARTSERRTEFLHDKDIRAWYNSVKEGSHLTADVYLRRLAQFSGGDPARAKALAKLDSKRAYRLLLDVVADYHEKTKPDSGGPYAGGYIESVVKSLKSWLTFNDIIVLKRIKIRGARETPTLADEVPPTPQDLKRILGVTDLRMRAAASIIAFTGCRLEVIGNFNGTDGLKVSDLRDLEIKGGEVSFKKVPAQMSVRKTVSKAGHDYFSFLPKEACEYVEVYLKSRMIQGEGLGPGSPVITASAGQIKRIPALKAKHITTTNVSDLLRKAIRNAGFAARPYVLKRYCAVRMQMAEADGMVPHVWVLFWTGWKGEIANTYTTNKGLPPDTIEQMRTAYEKAGAKYLTTSEKEERVDIKTELKREILLNVAGYKRNEVEKLDLSAIKDEDFQKMVRERLLGAMANNGNRQKVVPVDEVRDLIPQGWEYVAQLPTGEAIVRLPF